jgi:hypothetical protein
VAADPPAVSPHAGAGVDDGRNVGHVVVIGTFEGQDVGVVHDAVVHLTAELLGIRVGSAARSGDSFDLPYLLGSSCGG